MATGVPSKNGNGRSQPVSITYEGKEAVSAILKGEKGNFKEVNHGSLGKRLYFGDNINGLRTLLSDSSIAGKVTLVYIDPPFATQGTFLSRTQEKAYEDYLSGARYVEHLRARLILLRELLSEQGSLYLHLDENMIFEMKLVMDEVFGPSNYRNLIVRKKCNPKNYTRKTFGNIADYILFYSKTDNYVWNRPVDPLSVESLKEYHYTEAETGRRYMKVPVHAPGTRNGATGGEWRGMLPPPGKHWQYIPATLDEMDARGEIFWSKNGNPRRKVYLDEHAGVGVQDIWLDFKDAHNQNIKITGYPTEKNPDLLRRLIGASSNPGDLVLDCFAGSGTTLAVADEMQRHWIGMDNSIEALSAILKRFQQGLLPMGDYVQERKDKKSSVPQQATLFDTLNEKTPSPLPIKSVVHTPINDITIFMDRNALPEASSIVATWQQRSNTEYTQRTPLTIMVSEPTNFADICYQLHGRDSKLSKVIDSVGPCALVRSHAGFEFLVDAIIGQQLSKNAADTIIRRFRNLFASERPTPKQILSIQKQKVIDSGISQRKYDYIFDLAQKIESKHLQLSQLHQEDDVTIRLMLKAVKGIGDWTVDMYLLFGLARLNVFPVHDLALRKTMSTIYGLEVNDLEGAKQIAQNWEPYRSIASWYLYKHGNTRAQRTRLDCESEANHNLNRWLDKPGGYI
jgi:adenine-specific DNA-methyltransferase